MPTEADLENQFVQYAEAIGCLCLKLRIDGQNGWPDRTIFLPNGKVILMEFKAPKGRLRRKQAEWIGKLYNRGFAVYTASSLKSAIDILHRHLS